MARALLVLGLLPALGGCVAAVVPLAASGVLFKKEVIDDKPKVDVETPPPAVATPVPAPVSAAPALTPSLKPPLTAAPPGGSAQASGELVAAEPARTAPASTAQAAPAGLRSPTPAPLQTAELPPSAAARPADTGAPPPAPVPAAAIAPTPPRPSAAPRDALSLRAYDAFYQYVDAEARRDPVERPRDSAVLAAPGLLRPDRTDCSIRPPAVVIDLDPGDGVFDPDKPATGSRDFGQMLVALRLQQVDIFWISAMPAIKAPQLRQRLAESGLDPQGRDELLLMRRAEDRKQLRRKEVSETHCIVAIAGDTRSDFDELYQYLKSRDAAQPLEELVGAGWFLTPLPLEGN